MGRSTAVVDCAPPTENSSTLRSSFFASFSLLGSWTRRICAIMMRRVSIEMDQLIQREIRIQSGSIHENMIYCYCNGKTHTHEWNLIPMGSNNKMIKDRGKCDLF